MELYTYYNTSILTFKYFVLKYLQSPEMAFFANENVVDTVGDHGGFAVRGRNRACKR